MTPSKTTPSEKDTHKELAEERLNQLTYLQADFENYKKQFDKEKQHITKLANENLINDLLVILDDFDNALKHAQKDTEEHKGLKLIHNKFIHILNGFGLTPIHTKDKPFDPHYHEVVSTEPSDKEEGTIIEEIQKGYTLHSKVIRPSKVKIAEKH